MKSWLKGRIGLVSGCCFPPSLLAPQGAALAMVAAYVLTGEFGVSGTAISPEEALQRYEKRLHAFLPAKVPLRRGGRYGFSLVPSAIAASLLPTILDGHDLGELTGLPALRFESAPVCCTIDYSSFSDAAAING
jgi:hypothetical protein